MLIPTRSRGEAGASAIVVAASLVLLLGMAAIAIDIGAGFNERRQSQTSADVGVLAGALDYLDLGLCGAPNGDPDDGGCNELLSFVRDNLNASFSDPDWIAAWRTCTDPDMPPAFGPLSVDPTVWSGFSSDEVECISQSPQELRVRVPDQLLATTFGRVLGLNELRTLAEAQAALELPALGGVLPFGVLAGVSSHTCLLTAPAGNAEPPCDGPASGNFFTLEAQTWGPPSSQATITDCNNPGAPELRINTALGLDHFIAIAEDFSAPDPTTYSYDNSPAGTADDLTTREDQCTLIGGMASPSDRLPDTGPRDTMLAGSGADDSAPVLKGLITGQPADFASNAVNGGSNVTPRLLNMAGCLLPNGSSCQSMTRPLREKQGPTTYNYAANNVPLWEYLESVSFGTPIDCPTPTPDISSTDDVDTTEEMTCLLNEAPTQILFHESIETNNRFARVPQFHFEEWGSGTHWQPVAAYRMVYLHSVWFENGNSPVEFEPGESNTLICLGNAANCSSLSLLQMEAFLLPSGFVPAAVENSFPGGDTNNFVPILTK